MASHAFPRTAHWPNSLPSSFLLIPQACLLGQVPRQQGFISASRIFSFVASKGKLLKLSVVQGQFFCRSIFFFFKKLCFSNFGGLCWVFIAVLRLSLVVASRDYSLAVVHGLLVVASLVSVGGFQQLRDTSLVALWHVASSWTRSQTHIPFIDRQSLNYWITREM